VTAEAWAAPHVDFAFSSAFVGRVDMGAGQLRLGDVDFTIVLPHRPADDTPLSVPLDSIDTIAVEVASMVIVTRDGMHLTFVTSDVHATRAAILGACRALPELTRALRAMGSRRVGSRERPRAVEDEVRYFAPFLAARRAAAHAASPRDAIAAFEPVALAVALDTTLGAFATDRAGGRLPRWRAIEAELSELADPVRVVLRDLEPLAAAANADVDDLSRWRAWAGHLHAVFESADRAWVAIDAVLGREPAAAPARR
jgi:hypothetical protein